MNRLALPFLVILVACAPAKTNGPTTPPTDAPAFPPLSTQKAPPSPGPFSAQGAPDPMTCTQDADCMGDTVLCNAGQAGQGFCPADGAGCCVVSSTPVAQNRAYRTWAMAWRDKHCASVKCPVFSPSRPRDCEFAVRCVENTCQNTCQQ